VNKLEVVNNYAMTKKFLIAKFDCMYILWMFHDYLMKMQMHEN
jgi:hypothetical protein